MFEKNAGKPDRVIRVVLGLGLWYLADMNESAAAVIFALAGAAAISTGLYGWCVIYALLGVNTRGPEPSKRTPKEP
jgi:hypothetical protein